VRFVDAPFTRLPQFIRIERPQVKVNSAPLKTAATNSTARVLAAFRVAAEPYRV